MALHRGTFLDIISGGESWWGKTNSQIACLFNSNGLLDVYPSATPTSAARMAIGLGRFGFSFRTN